jgi:catechol 2,3-dioxygenase
VSDFVADAGLRIGHVHLRVAYLDRAIAFYRDTLGFTVTADGRAFGIPAAFLAAGDYHHHIGLNTFQGAGASPPPEGHTGLYHFALLYPGPAELGRAVSHIVAAGYPIGSAQDHGGTVSVYLRDPDGNGIELYYDRPRDFWRDAEGRPVLRNDPIPLAEIVAAAPR